MEQEYTKREIDLLITGIKEHISDVVVRPLERIEIQTIKTNGRVNNLENWRGYTAGAIAVIIIVVIPLFWRLYDSVSDNAINIAKLNKI